MKTLKDLKGVKEISKSEQKELNGGRIRCDFAHICPKGSICINNVCVPWLELE